MGRIQICFTDHCPSIHFVTDYLNVYELSKPMSNQECIPVGCVPPASVAVRGGGCLPGGCLPRGYIPLWTDRCLLRYRLEMTLSPEYNSSRLTVHQR